MLLCSFVVGKSKLYYNNPMWPGMHYLGMFWFLLLYTWVWLLEFSLAKDLYEIKVDECIKMNG